MRVKMHHLFNCLYGLTGGGGRRSKTWHTDTTNSADSTDTSKNADSTYSAQMAQMAQTAQHEKLRYQCPCCPCRPCLSVTHIDSINGSANDALCSLLMPVQLIAAIVLTHYLLDPKLRSLMKPNFASYYTSLCAPKGIRGEIISPRHSWL